MRALVHLGHEGVPDCTRCKRDPDLARELGCLDEPAPKPLYRIVCDECGGAGCEYPKDSPIPYDRRCMHGWAAVYRCPRRLTRDRPDIERAFRAFCWFKEYGALPADGGLMDQTAPLVTAFEVFRSESLALEAEAREKAKTDTKRADVMSRRGGQGRASRKGQVAPPG
jgi:hypothetical protein